MWNLPGAGIEPVTLYIGTWILMHSTTREIQKTTFLNLFVLQFLHGKIGNCHSPFIMGFLGKVKKLIKEKFWAHSKSCLSQLWL